MTSKLFVLVTLIGFGCGNNASQSQSYKPVVKVTGCSNVVVYLISKDSKSYYQIYLDAEKNRLEASNIFNLSDGEIKVYFKQFESEISEYLCNDLKPSSPVSEVKAIKAISGTVKIILSEKDLKLYVNKTPYEIHVELIDIKFKEEPLFSAKLGKVYVGWLPG